MGPPFRPPSKQFGGICVFDAIQRQNAIVLDIHDRLDRGVSRPLLKTQRGIIERTWILTFLRPGCVFLLLGQWDRPDGVLAFFLLGGLGSLFGRIFRLGLRLRLSILGFWDCGYRSGFGVLLLISDGRLWLIFSQLFGGVFNGSRGRFGLAFLLRLHGPLASGWSFFSWGSLLLRCWGIFNHWTFVDRWRFLDRLDLIGRRCLLGGWDFFRCGSLLLDCYGLFNSCGLLKSRSLVDNGGILNCWGLLNNGSILDCWSHLLGCSDFLNCRRLLLGCWSLVNSCGLRNNGSLLDRWGLFSCWSLLLGCRDFFHCWSLPFDCWGLFDCGRLLDWCSLFHRRRVLSFGFNDNFLGNLGFWLGSLYLSRGWLSVRCRGGFLCGFGRLRGLCGFGGRCGLCGLGGFLGVWLRSRSGWFLNICGSVLGWNFSSCWRLLLGLRGFSSCGFVFRLAFFSNRRLFSCWCVVHDRDICSLFVGHSRRRFVLVLLRLWLGRLLVFAVDLSADLVCIRSNWLVRGGRFRFICWRRFLNGLFSRLFSWLLGCLWLGVGRCLWGHCLCGLGLWFLRRSRVAVRHGALVLARRFGSGRGNLISSVWLRVLRSRVDGCALARILLSWRGRFAFYSHFFCLNWFC
ncbi:hypothetical protein ACCO45_006080 [Purpureocillium lilacinum]|uniref:Uncharacterized protein n=1 Tax=Purpureocillium lilacinum TaxID=33203 RepID=A0ACC4DY60_PURLI